jgi:hypothetical protein
LVMDNFMMRSPRKCEPLEISRDLCFTESFQHWQRDFRTENVLDIERAACRAKRTLFRSWPCQTLSQDPRLPESLFQEASSFRSDSTW